MMRKQGLKPFLKFSVCVLGSAFGAFWPLGLNAQQAVLYVGSDWCDASTAVEQIFTQAQFAKDAGIECVVVDEPELLTDAAKAQHEKQKAIRFELERYPGLAYFDAQGRCVLLEQGLAWNTSRKRLLSLVEKGRSRAKKIEGFLADNTAESAGKAIKLTLEDLGLSRSKDARGMKAAWDRLRELDPQDASGWRNAFEFNPSETVYKVQEFANAKNFAEGEKFIASLSTPEKTQRLSVNQKQGLKLLSFVLYRNVPERKEANRTLLREIAEMNPKTHFGWAARGMLAMLDGKVLEAAQPKKQAPARPAAKGERFVFPPPPKKYETVYHYARATIAESTLKTIIARKGGAAFLKKFFEDGRGLEDFFGSGPAKPSYDAALLCLDNLVYRFPEILSSRNAKKWAIAAALNAGEADEAKLGDYLGAILDIRSRKLFYRGADKLPVALMRYVVTPAQTNAEELLYMAKNHHIPPRRYYGACWFVPYRTYNFFGDSIHGSDYFKPWNGKYNIREATRIVGGVCGALSYYGSIAAKANGLPSTPGGQPQHCAYSLYLPETKTWGIGNNVWPYTGTHFNLWSWEFAFLDLTSDTFYAKGRKNALRAFWKVETERRKVEPQPQRSAMTRLVYESWHGRNLPEKWDAVKKLREEKNCGGFELDADGKADKVLLAWKGEYSFPKQAEVVVSLRSDDGSRFILGGKTILDNDGCHGMDLKRKTIEVPAGKQSFELQYFNFGGARGLELDLRVLYDFNPKFAAAYRRAAELSPGSYDLWEAYENYLATAQHVPAEAWKEFSVAAAQGLKNHPLPAWKLVERNALPAIEKSGGKDALLQQFISLHGIIRQDDRATAEFCNFGEILDRHAGMLGNDSVKNFTLFNAALNGQYGTKDAFGIVMRWGGAKFLKDASSASLYVSAISDLLKSKGGETDISRFLAGAIREAAQAENIAVFQSLCDLREAFTPAERKPVNLGNFTPLPLLSDKGLLRISTTSNWDHPEFYREVIDGKTCASNFHTDSENAPWAEIVLGGTAEIAAVYIENIHTQNNWRAVPFKVEVSEDGKAWTTVARADKSEEEWKFTFPPVKGRYVRVTRIGDGNTFLHFRKFMVFGKKLY